LGSCAEVFRAMVMVMAANQVVESGELYNH
jgi:hypothetical protein